MVKKEIKIKRDRYFKRRGSTAIITKVKCSKCNKVLFSYQKDGVGGWLKRCYFNRILSPMPNGQKLVCHGVIGTTKKYKDGRLAYELARGKFKRTYGGQKTK